MKRCPWLRLALASLVALLAGCAVGSGPPVLSTPTPNTSPGTHTTGPVSIATDHSIYAPTDAIQVAVTNGLSVPIYALDEAASCSILVLQVQQLTGEWQTAQGASCPLGRTPVVVAVAPHAIYTATIQAGYPGLTQATFIPGIYRLILSYSTSATEQPPSLLGSIVTVPSVVLAIMGPTPTVAPIVPSTSPGSPTTIQTPTPAHVARYG
jgi:hypothetical protein